MLVQYQVNTGAFPITAGLHQLNVKFLVMEELTRRVQDEVLWCMLFADNIVLIRETRK